MPNILSRANRAVLEEFAWSNVLVAFDYDGTLAPIVADPERARMRPTTRALLQAVARRYQVVVISGRAQRDAFDRLRGVEIDGVIGNHGREPSRAAGRQRVEVRRWLPVLRRCVAPWRGVVIEDKSYSVAI